MTSVYITRRMTRTSGARYVVRFRLGGRETPVMHAGSFRTRKEAEARARWVAGELAAMRVPNRRALAESQSALTVSAVVTQWLRRRVDVAQGTRENYGPAILRIDAGIGSVRLSEMTPGIVAEWVADLVEQGAGRTVLDRCMAVLRLALDDQLDPNPARHRSIRLPKTERLEVNPPPHSHWQLILDGVTTRMALPLRVLEGTGLRVGELIELQWGDLDFPGSRLRVRSGKTRAARRWVPVPPALMMDVDALVPREDRIPERRVFPGLLDGSLRMAMRRACSAAAIPLYSPHDLRHRYISLLVKQGMDLAAVAGRVGHTRKSLTADVYLHVLMEEPS